MYRFCFLLIHTPFIVQVKLMVRCYLFVLALVLFLTSPAISQPTLTFKRIDITNYPEISLAFKVTCLGQFANFVQKQNFEVIEDSIKVGDFELWCPPEVDCCISISMVLDRSGSMDSAQKIEDLKKGANLFIDQLNTGGYSCDEAAVISFNHDWQILQYMTGDKAALHGAVNSLFANGATAAWNAAMLGIQHLRDRAKNRCKAVIMITDGINNQPGYKYQDVIASAVANDIKVFTIGLGLIQGSRAELELRAIAQQTGGRYHYTPTGAELVKVFESIREVIRESYQECLIKYRADCPDGNIREVELLLKDFCNGSAHAVKTYIAPTDYNQYKTLRAKLGEASAMATREVMIPLTVENDVEAIFGRSDFSIWYDRAYLTFDRVEKDGTLLENVLVSSEDNWNTIRVYTHNRFLLKGPGTLLRLYFRTSDVAIKASVPVNISNWNFEGFCLIPKMDPGRIFITPREPKIHCDSYSPSALKWDDLNKQYTPNPFTFRTEVFNTGTKEARNVVAKIRFDPAKAKLRSPLSAIQYFTPQTIKEGESGFVTWQLEALKMDDLDSVQICIDIDSDNHERTTCCRTILINPVQTSSIVCDLSAPDTVFFREQYYEPETFDVQLTAANTGDGLSRDLIGQLLQDTRFNKITEPRILMSSLFQPGDTAQATFTVQIRPRDTDGYDTVWAQVQGADSDPTWCFYPIWVQRTRVPEFSLLCSTPDDSLEFIEESGTYFPNPFTVTTLAENIGETYAEDCELTFVGPPQFTPLGQNPRSIGLMNVNDTHNEEWQIRALPRAVGGWDTLHFQILGKGGLGKKIVLGDCLLPVYVPAMRRPIYELVCTAPDSLRFEDVDYKPNPFEFSALITNNGNSPGYGLNPRIVLPDFMSLESGSVVQHIPVLNPNESLTVTWSVRSEKRLQPDYSRLCATVVDSGGTTEQCCSDIFIPAVKLPNLNITCSTIDTMYMDPSTGEYLGNPFKVELVVANTGTGMALDLGASIGIQGTNIRVLDSITKNIGDLPAGESRTIEWAVEAYKRPNPADIPITLSVFSTDTEDLECMRSVFIPSHQKPLLECQTYSLPEDSLFFNWATGEFEQAEFEMHLSISNIGFLRAENVQALLVAPDGVTFADGESPQKSISKALLLAGDGDELSWRMKPVRDKLDATKEFQFVISADNATESYCSDQLWIQGSPKSMTLSIPRDVLFRYGEKRFIPVNIDKTIGKDLMSYSFVLEYNPDVVSLLHLSNVATLTDIGWVGARIRELSPGRLEISDYTTGTPLHTDEGILLHIYTEGVFHREQGIDEYGYTELSIDPASVQLNFGDITASTNPGSIYVTNECIEPLSASDGFALAQNRPNPFNPSTNILFALPRDEHVRLIVFDKMGRELSVLVDAVLEEGQHSVTFVADGFPSGMYFYKLEAGGITKLRKMILAR
jgi:von Willebrand factor type A domain-containing protein